MKAHVIYGPPGTGKSTELLGILDSLVKAGVPPAHIGYLSFTKAATGEALRRLGLSKSNNVCTIHSLCYRLGGVNPGSVVDYRKLKILSQDTGVRITSRGPDEEDIGEGDQYLGIISYAENVGVTYAQAYEDSEHPGGFDEFLAFAEAYRSWKNANCYVDFNDMLHRVIEKKTVKHGITHLIVDEAQDLSNLQWAALGRLFPDLVEIHVAGDDDQSLYVWSGANVHGMAKFEEDFSARRTVLQQSWRVPRAAHRLASDVVGRIARRVDKTYLPREADGTLVEHTIWDSSIITGDDTMILARTHSHLREIELTLRDDNVAYHKDGGIPGMLQNKYASAIRSVEKVKRGDDLTDSEFSHLRACCDDADRAKLDMGDFSVPLKKDWDQFLIIPFEMVDYYRSVDLFAWPKVRLSTIHASKGREAEQVILFNSLTSRVIESMDKDPDSEARVFYVGVTRTKNRLDLILDGEGYQL